MVFGIGQFNGVNIGVIVALVLKREFCYRNYFHN